MAFLNKYMAYALDEAHAALREGEVPVGAVIVRDNTVISAAHNMKEQSGDPTAHAEILAIRRAAEVLGNWRLSGCDIYVTLEPCPMCAAAILESRIRSLYFGCYDSSIGAASNKVIELDWKPCNVYCGICEDECEKILKAFFKAQR